MELLHELKNTPKKHEEISSQGQEPETTHDLEKKRKDTDGTPNQEQEPVVKSYFMIDGKDIDDDDFQESLNKKMELLHKLKNTSKNHEGTANQGQEPVVKFSFWIDGKDIDDKKVLLSSALSERSIKAGVASIRIPFEVLKPEAKYRLEKKVKYTFDQYKNSERQPPAYEDVLREIDTEFEIKKIEPVVNSFSFDPTENSERQPPTYEDVLREKSKELEIRKIIFKLFASKSLKSGIGIGNQIEHLSETVTAVGSTVNLLEQNQSQIHSTLNTLGHNQRQLCSTVNRLEVNQTQIIEQLLSTVNRLTESKEQSDRQLERLRAELTSLREENRTKRHQTQAENNGPKDQHIQSKSKDEHFSSPGCKNCGCGRKCQCHCHQRRRKTGENRHRNDVEKYGEIPKQPHNRKKETNRKRILKKKERQGQRESKPLADSSIADDDRKNDHNEPGSDEDGFVVRPKSVAGCHPDKSLTRDLEENDNTFSDVHQRNYRGACASGAPPDDPSSGDDDDDDEDCDKSGETTNSNRVDRGRSKNAMRQTRWSIDQDEWDQCISTQDEKICKEKSKSLLKEWKLPNCELLNKVCKRFGRKSEMVSEICNGICDHLKQKYNFIVGAWPGYSPHSENKDVVFAAFTNSSKVIQDENFDLICRVVDQTRTEQENKAIMERERKEPPNDEDLQKLTQVQRKCAPRLMDEHKRLVRVTVSWIKHTTGKTLDSALRKCLCIALYVQIRGLVPLNEEPFPNQIDDYPVDVREGLVLLCGGPGDYHNPLKMGCRIFGARFSGTLGAFVMFKNRPLDQYALTSAHVLCGPEDLKLPCENGHARPKVKIKVFQPENYPENYFGDVVKVVHQQGNEQTAGMEISLIQVHKRQPDSGNFAGLEQGIACFDASGKPHAFTSGEVVHPSVLKSWSKVYKYGSETGLTEGYLRHIYSTLRTFKADGVTEQMVLHGQIEVEFFDGFAVPGDSGALVMTKLESSDKLVAVGIFEGEARDKTCFYVTPLDAVLKELGDDCYLNTFTQDTVPEDLRMDVNDTDSLSIQNRVAGLESKIDILIKEIKTIKEQQEHFSSILLYR